MVQAVELLYFVTDIYSESRKKSSGPSAELVFQEYAEDERFPCSDVATAERIFDHHHLFLMMCFLNKAQGLSWSNTPLYQRFRRRFPKDFDNCKARIEGRYSQIQPERSAQPSKFTSATTTGSKSTQTNAKAQTAHGKVTIPKPVEAPKKDDNWWEAAALFEFMQKAVNQRVLRAGRNQITVDRVAELVVRRYEIEEVEIAKNVLLVHAQNLCYMMEHPRRKAVQFFASEPIYKELAAGHDLSAAEQRRAEGVELKPRRDHGTLRDGENESSDTSDEEDAITTPVRRPPGRRKQGRLSVLRPRSGKFSGKSKGISIKPGRQKGGKGKAPVPASDDSEAEQSDETTSSEEDEGIDTPTQALSPSREKRKLDDMDADQEERGRWKRTASASAAPDSPPTTGDSDLEEATAVPPLPLRYRPSNVPPHVRPASSSANTRLMVSPPIVSTPLPTYEPNGPRDSWICSFDGCTQKIYGCSKELGRQLITEHLEDHSRGREKVVGILWREQDRLNLPVSNLIKKIREMNEASTPLFPMPGALTTAVRPIQRPL
jgi:hypothetical protein